MWPKFPSEMKHPMILQDLGWDTLEKPSHSCKDEAPYSHKERHSPTYPLPQFQCCWFHQLCLDQTEVLSRCFGGLELVLLLYFPLIETCFTLFSECPSVDRAETRSVSYMAACLLIFRNR